MPFFGSWISWVVCALKLITPLGCGRQPALEQQHRAPDVVKNVIGY